MRKIREVLRMTWVLGLSQRQVGRSLGLSQATVCDHLLRSKVAGLTWKQAEELDEEELEGRLFPPARDSSNRQRFVPRWSKIHEELKRKGVTLSLLWQEYREDEPEGYGDSRFCDLYREWKGKLDVCLRQDYRAGEMLLVDYAGQTVAIHDARTGEVLEASIFVAVLGASSFTCAETTRSQDLADWIRRWLASLLHEVRPNDPTALVFTAAVVFLVATLAVLEPVRRASRLDPAVILRDL